MADIGIALLCAACSSVWQICWSRRTYAQPAGSGNGPRKLAAEVHNLAASRPGLQWACSGCGFGHFRTADQECRGFSRSLHDTEPPNSSSLPQLPASHNRQGRAGDPSGGLVTLPLCRAGPGRQICLRDNHPLWGSRLHPSSNRLLINIFPKYQSDTIIGIRMTANVRARSEADCGLKPPNNSIRNTCGPSWLSPHTGRRPTATRACVAVG